MKAPVTAQPLKPIGRLQEDLNSQCKSFKDCNVFFHFLAIFKLNHLLDDFSLKNHGGFPAMAVRGEDLMGQLEGELKTSMAEPSRILQMVGMPSVFG